MTSRIAPRIILIVNLVLAYVAGVITIVGFFTRGTFADLAGSLAQWVAVMSAFALLVGFANLLKVHVGRILQRRGEWFYSLLLVGSALVVLGFGLLGGRAAGDPYVAWIFRWIYQPLGAAIFSLLAFFVTTAFFRALTMRSAEAIALLVTALLVIIGLAPFSTQAPLGFMSDVKDWLFSYPILAGTRAILLGVAFGAIGISLRVLLGFDRPYME